VGDAPDSRAKAAASWWWPSVVIHTGAANTWPGWSRAGLRAALLGETAVAVHDIEQSLLGTSLGVDMKLGNSVEGGHRHHLRAINTIAAREACPGGGTRRVNQRDFFTSARARSPVCAGGFDSRMTGRCPRRKWI